MPTSPRDPLRLETRADDRVVVLGCQACDVNASLSTADPIFATAVQAFFERHTPCVFSTDVSESSAS